MGGPLRGLSDDELQEEIDLLSVALGVKVDVKTAARGGRRVVSDHVRPPEPLATLSPR